MDVPSNATARSSIVLVVHAVGSSGLQRNATFTVDVERVFGVEVVSETEDAMAVPGESILLKFSIKNTGNGESRVNLTYGLPPLWDFDAPSVVTIDPWRNWTVVATIEVDDETPEGTYKILLLAEAGGVEAKDEIEIKIVLPDPAIKSLTLSRQIIDEGQNVSVVAEIVNLGVGNATDVKVVIYDNGKIIFEQYIDNLVPGYEETVGLSYKFKSGYHTVSVVVAIDGDELTSANNAEQKDLRVNKKGGIPWPGAAMLAISVALAFLIYGRKRRN
jgi:uncharacterized membrane protein